MSSVPVLVPFPYTIPPVSMVVPFTYVDGTTFLEVISELQDQMNNTLIPAVNQSMNNVLTDAQAGVTNAENTVTSAQTSWTNQFNAYMANVNASLQALNDTAMGTLIDSPTSATTTALKALYAAKSDVATLLTETQSGYLSQASLNAAYASVSALTSQIATVNAAIATTNSAVNANGVRIDDNGFLFGGFTSNAGSAGQYGAGGEYLSLFYSPDGKSFYSGAEHQAYIPADGMGLRDPSMLYYNNQYFVAYTRNNGLDKNFAIAVSPNGAPGSFTLLATPNMGANIASMTRCWAPEFVTDTNGDIYIFFASVDVNNHGSVYWIKALDSSLGNWSTPTRMTWGGSGEPVHYIDPCLVRHTDGNWYFFYSTGADILRAKSTTGLTGTYSTDQGASNWTGWGTNIEAPEIVWDEQRGVYKGYFDQFSPETGYHWSESTDLTSWSAPVAVAAPNGALRSTEVLRHGSFVPLKDRREANKVIAGQSMQGPVYHAQFTFSLTLGNGGAPSTITAWTVDTNETLDANFITVDGSGNFTFNRMGVYSIDIGAGFPAGPTVTRGFLSYIGGANGTTEEKRVSSGVESALSFTFANFKPRAVGEKFKIQAFEAWSSAETSVTLTGRMWVTLEKPV